MARLLIALSALFLLFASWAYAAGCTLGAGASCSIAGSDCCSTGLVCKVTDLATSSGGCCIAISSGIACSSSSQCCSGKCEGNLCVQAWSCNGTCTSSADCASACPLCIFNSGGSKACQSCIPDGSATACATGNDCCNAKCSPATLRCVSCFSQGTACNVDSDCCAGSRCQSNGTIGAKTCVSQVGLSYSGGPCATLADCRGSPPSLAALYCDTLNQQANPSMPGMCRSCIPDSLKCDGTIPCCGSSPISCAIPPSGGSTAYCLASTGSGTRYLFTNWSRVGASTFEPSATTVHGGSTALHLSNGGADSYLYNTALQLADNGRYLLEFYAAGANPPRFSIYDENNDAYLAANGSWAFSPMDAGNQYEQPIIITPGISGAGYSKYNLSFSTLAYNVSGVQLRFYPPSSGEGWLDDVTLTRIYDISILAWIKTGGAMQDNSSVFWQLGSENSEPQGINWFITSNRTLNMGLYSSNGLGGASVAPQVRLGDNNWHQVAFVAQRYGSYKTYLDGNPVSSGAFALGRLNSSAQLILGKNGITGSAFKGRMDEVRVYDRALSDSEVLKHYQGNYQDKLLANMSISYSSVQGLSSKNLSSYYNADLRVRRLLPGTILSLPFDEALDSSGLVYDHSQFLSHAVNSGAAWNSSGRSGGAYLFNGSGSQVNLSAGQLAFGTTDFTVSAWISPNSSVSASCGPQAIFVADNTGLWNEQGTLGFTLNGPDGFASGSAFSDLLNTWTHVAAVRQGSNLSLYENGTLIGSVASAAIGNYSVTSASARIGGSRSCSAGTSTFSGKMDGFQAFARALAPEEIGQLYNDTGLSVDSKILAQN